MQTFAFLTDLHYGTERKQGRTVPLHDMKAFGSAYAFLQDFKPDVLILGGDILDAGVISHHNKNKPGRTEGMRLLRDAEGCRDAIFKPLDQLRAKRKVYLFGNHERFLEDLVDEMPGMEGIVDPVALMDLKGWEAKPQGSRMNLGKLWFMHGDTLKGGQGMAKAAVTDGGRSLRFGHYHTYAVAAKSCFLDESVHTAICVPCLCSRDPKYGQGKGNSWLQGFNWGYIHPDGTFNDYVTTIHNGKMAANGKVYKG